MRWKGIRSTALASVAELDAESLSHGSIAHTVELQTPQADKSAHANNRSPLIRLTRIWWLM